MMNLTTMALAFLILGMAPGAQPEPQEAPELATATFAGGCFWCMEPPFDKLEGVVSTTSGYTGGHLDNPSYEQVSSGGTGHTEAVEIVYDPAKVSYEKLLEVFWVNIDPTDAKGQFCDRGSQVSQRYLLQLGRATTARRGVEEKDRCVRAAPENGSDGSDGGDHVLPRRGVPPGLLPAARVSLQALPSRLRP